MTHRNGAALSALTLLLGISSPLGCASEKTTTTTTTHVREFDDPDVASGPEARSDVVTEERTTTTDDACGGVLSCTADFVGDVIAFPFRLIGGVFKAIF